MLAGRLAVVTGAASGIGRAVAVRFAKQGASVVAVDVDKRGGAETAQSLVSDDGQQHIFMHCDVSDIGLVTQLCDYVTRHYGRPACTIVNNAGVTMDGRLHRMSEQQFDWVHAVNLKAPFLVTKIFTAAMLSGGDNAVQSGSVTNVSSIVAKTGNFGQANYASAKSGLLGLTKACAIELGPHNIRVNAVLPGFVDTPMSAKVPAKVLAEVLRNVPLGRFGRPDEVAAVCAFLASEAASYVNGACVEVTGGLGM